MRNVYLLFVDGDVEGVFSSADKANEYADSLDLDLDAEVFIEQQQLDPVVLAEE